MYDFPQIRRSPKKEIFTWRSSDLSESKSPSGNTHTAFVKAELSIGSIRITSAIRDHHVAIVRAGVALIDKTAKKKDKYLPMRLEVGSERGANIRF
jgi:hypothetical protein